MRNGTGWIFGIGAGVYEAVTAHEPWRRDCPAMASRLPGRRVLDVGIGPGVSGIEMARAAPAMQLVGLDRSAAMLGRAKRRAGAAGLTLPLVRADASRLPFADASYDGVTG